MYEYIKAYTKHKKKTFDIMKEEIGLKLFYYKDNVVK